RCAETDGGAARDQAWPVGLLRACDGGGDRLGVVAVDPGRGPTGRFEAFHLIDRVGERQRPVDGYAAVGEPHGSPAYAQMAGERDGFLADSFHQVAVGGEDKGAVVDEVASELGR